nr:hypothetical protein [Escherichia coli]
MWFPVLFRFLAHDRITRRTVNGEPAEQWQYDDHGWLTEISHLSEGHRVAVHYGYDDKGRPYRRLSQISTSFIASDCQGIHRVRLVA